MTAYIHSDIFSKQTQQSERFFIGLHIVSLTEPALSDSTELKNTPKLYVVIFQRLCWLSNSDRLTVNVFWKCKVNIRISTKRYRKVLTRFTLCIDYLWICTIGNQQCNDISHSLDTSHYNWSSIMICKKYVNMDIEFLRLNFCSPAVCGCSLNYIEFNVEDKNKIYFEITQFTFLCSH